MKSASQVKSTNAIKIISVEKEIKTKNPSRRFDLRNAVMV